VKSDPKCLSNLIQKAKTTQKPQTTIKSEKLKITWGASQEALGYRLKLDDTCVMVSNLAPPSSQVASSMMRVELQVAIEANGRMTNELSLSSNCYLDMAFYH
jgi:hypothetical protein